MDRDEALNEVCLVAEALTAKRQDDLAERLYEAAKVLDPTPPGAPAAGTGELHKLADQICWVLMNCEVTPGRPGCSTLMDVAAALRTVPAAGAATPEMLAALAELIEKNPELRCVAPGDVTIATEAVMQVLQARAEAARQATVAGRCGQWMFIDAMGLRESIAAALDNHRQLTATPEDVMLIGREEFRTLADYLRIVAEHFRSVNLAVWAAKTESWQIRLEAALAAAKRGSHISEYSYEIFTDGMRRRTDDADEAFLGVTKCCDDVLLLSLAHLGVAIAVRFRLNGASPRTYEALKRLMVAMAEDNAALAQGGETNV